MNWKAIQPFLIRNVIHCVEACRLLLRTTEAALLSPFRSMYIKRTVF